MVEFAITVLKVLASVFLSAFFIAGVFKADPRTHNPEIRPFAEFLAGFLICSVSLFGLYYLWIW